MGYELTKNNSIPQEWKDSIAAKCGQAAASGGFQSRSLGDIGGFALIFGAFYGFLLSHAFTPKLLSGTVLEDTWRQKLLRILVAVCVTLPWKLISFLVAKTGL